MPCKANLCQKIFPDADPNITYNQEDFIFKPHSNEETYRTHLKIEMETCVFYRDGKAAALQEKFRAPQDIVGGLLKHREDLPGTYLLDIQNLKKAINRARAKSHPSMVHCFLRWRISTPLGFTTVQFFSGRRHPARHLLFFYRCSTSGIN